MPYFLAWDHVQELYELETGTRPERLAKYVKDWFHERATDAGWDATAPMKNVLNNTGAGFLVWINASKPAAPKKAPKTTAATSKTTAAASKSATTVINNYVTIHNYSANSQADDD